MLSDLNMPGLDGISLVKAALQRDPAVKARLAAQGLQAWSGGPEAFSQQIRADYAKYGAVVRQAGIQFD